MYLANFSLNSIILKFNSSMLWSIMLLWVIAHSRVPEALAVVKYS